MYIFCTGEKKKNKKVAWEFLDELIHLSKGGKELSATQSPTKFATGNLI